MAAVLLINFVAACPQEARYCKNGLFTPEYEYEFFEGSLPLTQTGVYMKEYASEPKIRISLDQTTSEVMRVAQIWQFENKSPSSDVIETQQRFQHESTLGEWFIGDVVPMGTCVYVVGMSSEQTPTGGLTKHYAFEQMITAVKAETFQNGNMRRVNTHSNHIARFVSDSEDRDLPSARVEINWLPDWNAFYYMSEGRLILKIDPSPVSSPCNPDTPLFGDNQIIHKVYETPESGKQGAVMIDSVYLHRFLYFAISTDAWKVYKAFGKADRLKI